MDGVYVRLWWRGFEPEENLRLFERLFLSDTEAVSFIKRMLANPDIHVHRYSTYRLEEFNVDSNDSEL